MGTGSAALFVILLAGALGGNDLIVVASGLMLVLQFADVPGMFGFLEVYATQLGIVFLFIGLLLPFATGQMGLAAAFKCVLSGRGLVAIAIGAFGAYLAAQGVSLLTTRPETTVGMVIGSVLGVSFLGGIPAGPLVAAGLAALIYRLVDH
ncbi:MAG: DUF441 domain-containing protein [Limnochordia bacterium]|jgi:uncharacterized membrane protein (DUF441 family)